jgi:phospholipid N-methyltransferase
MRRILTDYGLFLKEFRRTFHTTGAILPSSPGLARALARFVRQPRSTAEADAPRPARRILEVGPGTGAVTRRIIQWMNDDDRLDLVELNDEFVARLRDRLQNDPLMSGVADRTDVMHRPIQEVEGQHVYDVAISGLPLNNFTVDDVDAILSTCRRLLKPTGTLSFFEYVAVRPVRGAISRQQEKQRLRGISRSLGRLLDRHEIKRQVAWINVPPAWVHHVRFDIAAPAEPG